MMLERGGKKHSPDRMGVEAKGTCGGAAWKPDKITRKGEVLGKGRFKTNRQREVF